VRVRPRDTYDSAVQSIDETPDPTRPRNVWPRLLAAGGVVLAAVVLVGACVAALAGSVPDRELSVPLDELELGKPRLLPVTTWGADRAGLTFGAWVVFLPGGDGVRAYLSRDPTSGCQVQWEIVVTNGEARGVFIDRCGGTLYDLDGRSLIGTPERGLDRFEARVHQGTVIVAIEQVALGPCIAAPATDCSSADELRYRGLPSGPLEGLPGYRRQ
jgi:hypothetical protein